MGIRVEWCGGFGGLRGVDLDVCLAYCVSCGVGIIYVSCGLVGDCGVLVLCCFADWFAGWGTCWVMLLLSVSRWV